MALSRPTRDRLIAFAAALAVIVVAFGVVLIAKSCDTCTVKYYVDSQVVRTERVRKGGKADGKNPKDEVTDGRIFDGWFTSEGEDGVRFNFSQEIDESICLYARFR